MVEMSDGRNERLASTGNDDSQRNSGILSGGNRDGYDTSAPVATSVSAPESAEQFYAKSAFNFVWYRSNGDIFEFAEAYALEYASSSSATLLAANEVIRRQLKKVCDQAEAAEAKCAELQREAVQQGRILSELRDELRQTKKLKDTALETHDELRDSRDRLQAELNKPCCGERHRMNHELKVAALGDPPEQKG